MDVQAVQGIAQTGQISIWHLALNASFVVQVVMIGLALASIWSWAIIFEKLYVYSRTRSANARFEQTFWSGQSLEDLYLALGPRSQTGLSAIFMAAMREWKRSQESAVRAGFQGVQKRIEKVMDVQVQKEMGNLEAGLLFLATVGSATPFVGLFGTVWGIMHAFIGLSNLQQVTLATVAPGIAEALGATAIGLFAAIPAVIAYNRFANHVERLETRFDSFLEEFSTILQRHTGPRASHG